MRPSIEQAVSGRGIEASGQLDFLNRELIPLLQALRDYCNHTSRFKATLDTTGDNAFTTIWTSPTFPQSGVWRLSAMVASCKNAGSGTTAEGATYLCESTYGRYNGGTITLFGSEADDARTALGGVDIRWDVSGETIVLQVKDGGVAQRWLALPEVVESTF